MLVNNETGAVTDIRAVSEVLRAAGGGVLFHCDAVQGFLKRPFSPAGLGVDLLSLSGHKIHAPKGVGALYIRQGLSLPPLLWGGGQENGKRSGTESLPLIAALGAAATAGFSVMTEAVERMGRLRDRAVSRLRAENPEIIFLCDGAAHILSLSLPGYRSEVLMNFLDANGIFVSKSSACKRGGRSHVLEAMGLPVQVIDGAVRVSLSDTRRKKRSTRSARV
jgi:cysteine desulfurase